MFTLAGAPGGLASVVLDGAKIAVERVDVVTHEGIHPRVGAIDVAPIVYLDDADRGAACAEALVLGRPARPRSSSCRCSCTACWPAAAPARSCGAAGPQELAERIESGELVPDFGPRRLHPTAGAVLVAARPPLVAFNVELAPPATLEDAKAIAAMIREGGEEGLPGAAGDRPVARSPPASRRCR